MHYEVVVKLKVDAPDRTAVLKKVVNIQRVAVQQGFLKENIQLVQVIEATTDPVVDITSEVQAALVPPSVVYASPTSTGIDTSTPVTIQFTSNVDPATVTLQTVLLNVQGGAVVPATLQFDAEASTVVLTPVAPLAAGQTYVVKVTQNVRSVTGVSLAAPLTFTFST